MDRLRDRLQGDSGSGSKTVGSDALHRHLQELRSKIPGDRMLAARKIRLYAEEEARERREEGFQKVLNLFLEHIQTWGNSSDASERRACLLLMDQLIDVAMNEDSERVVIRFANQLNQTINQFGSSTSSCSASDIDMLRLITGTLGHLVRSASPTLTAESVEFQVKRAIEWLRMDQHESRRYAAVFVLMELSRNAPTLFSVHVSAFFEYIWLALSDPILQIRTSAAVALRNCLRLISQRTSRQMLKYLDAMFRVARQEFPEPGQAWDTNSGPARSRTPKRGKPFGNRNDNSAASNVAGIHGALLTFYELLDECTGSFMGMYFHDVLNDCVMRKEITNHKDQQIREMVIAILPRIAGFCPTELVQDFLETCTKHMIRAVESASPNNKQYPLSIRATAFRALGQLSTVPQISDSIRPHLPKMLTLVKTALTPQNKSPFCQEALVCVAAMVSAQGIPRELDAQFSVLIPVLFNGGLTQLLVSTLSCIGKIGPGHMPKIRHLLLEEVTIVLGMGARSTNTSSRRTRQRDDSDSVAGGSERNISEPWASSPYEGSSKESSRGFRSHSTEVMERIRSPSRSGQSKLSPSRGKFQRFTAKTSLWFHSHVPQVTQSQAVLTHAHENVSGTQIETSVQKLALRTLGTFDFGSLSLFAVLLGSVVRFLEASDPEIRREAAMASSRLLLREVNSLKGVDSEGNPMNGEVDDYEMLKRIQQEAGKQQKAAETGNAKLTIDISAITNNGTNAVVVSDREAEIEHIIERLVLVAMTDSDPEIRCCVISELDKNFSKYLVNNPDNLRSLFVLVNDHSFTVRAASLKCIGRLAGLAPAYIMPSLRGTLMRLLSELGFAVDSRQDEESVTLLALLVRGLDPTLARPHIKSMLDRLLPRLQDSNSRVSSAVMAALGEIAEVAGEVLTPYVEEIFARAMASLEDHSSDSFTKREVALSTIAKVASNTVMSVWPYFFHRHLLNQVLSVLTTSSTPWKLRRQAMVTLGVLGALDPWLHRMNTLAFARGDTGLLLGNDPEDDSEGNDMLDLHTAKFFGKNDWFDSDSEDGFDEGEYMVELPGGGSSQIAHTGGTHDSWVQNDLDSVVPKNKFETEQGFNLSKEMGSISSGIRRHSSIYAAAMGQPDPSGTHQDGDASRSNTRRNRRSSVRGLLEKQPSFRTSKRRSTVISNANAANFVAGLLSGSTRPDGEGAENNDEAEQSHTKYRSNRNNHHGTSGTNQSATSAQHANGGAPQFHGNNPGGGNQAVRALAVTEEHAALFGGLALNSDGLPNANSILPSMIQDPRDYYSTVTIVALVAILSDDSLNLHHKKVIEAILIIFKSMELRCVRFLPVVMPRLLYVVRCKAENTKDPRDVRGSYFQDLEKLVSIVQGHILQYLPAIADTMAPFWETEILPEVLSLTLMISKKLSHEELRTHVPELLPDLLNVLQAERDKVSYEYSLNVLEILATMGPALGDLMYLVLPKLVRLIDRSMTVFSAVPFHVREQAVRCLNLLIKQCQIADHASRVIHPLVRTLQDCRLERYDEKNQRLLFELVMETFMALIYRLEEEFSPWVLMINKALRQHLDSYSSSSGLPSNPFSHHGPTSHDLELVENYYSLVQRVLRGQTLPKPPWYREKVELASFGVHHDLDEEEDPSDKSLLGPGRRSQMDMNANSQDDERREVDPFALKKAWDTTQRSTEEDWIEWLRRFSLTLIAQSPWPAVRSCAALAQIYEPLAKQLFNCAFESCWKVLNHEFREHLVDSIEVAVQSVNMPADMLQLMLNLAEFMEHDDNPLPIDIRTLSRLALRCHAFTKALHYKELEFRMSPHTCVPDLISINNNLEHPEAAFGVVSYARIHHPNSIEVQPTWYERLGQWQEALNAYEAKAYMRVSGTKGLSRIASDGGSPTTDEPSSDDWKPVGHNRRRSTSTNDFTLPGDEVWQGKSNSINDEMISVTLGRLRCQRALCEWNAMASLGEQKWSEILEIEAARQTNMYRQRRQSRSSTASSLSKSKGENDDPENSENNDTEDLKSSRGGDLSSTWVPGGRTLPPKIAFGEELKYTSSPFSTQSPFLLKPARSQSRVGFEPHGLTTLAAEIGLFGDQHNDVENSGGLAGVLELGNLGSDENRNSFDQSGTSTLTNRSDALHQYAQKVATLSAYASWALGNWSDMTRYTNITTPGSLDGNFLRAILALHRNRFDEAETHVDRTYRVLDSALSASISESYTRAYNRLVIVQQLAEIQEIVTFKRFVAQGQHREAADCFQRMRRLWCQRLQGVQQSVEVLLPLLQVRSMVVPPQHDLDTWLNFVKVCRKKGRHTLSMKALLNLGIGNVDSESDVGYSITNLLSSGVNLHQQLRGSELRKASVTSVRSKMALEESPSLIRNLRSQAQNSSPLIPRCELPEGHRTHPRVAFAYLKHLWAIGARHEALGRLEQLTHDLIVSLQRDGIVKLTFGSPSTLKSSKQAKKKPQKKSNKKNAKTDSSDTNSDTLDTEDVALMPPGFDLLNMSHGKPSKSSGVKASSMAESIRNVPWKQRKRLVVRCHCKLGEWRIALADRSVDSIGNLSHQDSFANTLNDVLGYYERAIELDSTSYKAWHSWALTSFQAFEYHESRNHQSAKSPRSGRKSKRTGRSESRSRSKSSHRSKSRSRKQSEFDKGANERKEQLVVQAVNGFFRSIALGHRDGVNVLQDILRLLTLWFAHTDNQTVLEAIRHGLSTIGIETWLGVIPQLIARVNSPGDLVCELLNRIGREHPQVLIYPLTVASKSDHQDRAEAASQVLTTMRESYPTLVDEAQMVSRELIRVAVMWHEMWLEGLEEASRRYFTPNRDIASMIEILVPLHEIMERGPETLQEVGFLQAFGRELREAYEWVKVYQKGGNASHMNQAWDLYYQVFKTVNSMEKAKKLELRHVSPKLLHASNLQLVVPGTYQVGQDVTCINKFWPSLRVITSKQRPRVISLTGSDGAKYMFLLKGHEDLRLDERVMQLFGLVNTLLASDAETNRQNLDIQRYTVIPLSNKAGFIEWVPNTDTFHSLIREYRTSRGVLCNVEEHLIHQMTGNYQDLRIHQKLEVFEHALSETSGQDLAQVLWLKSPNSEVWLDRRTNFTRSLAAMSMVGYILGLGDRHLSNLMLERASGRVLHIDFGDCFEVTMHREQHPEKIPFRLTRMLVNAMEASGIEGNFRFTCESVMGVLRQNRESVMTMLEAFVYDPLITWRLLKPNVPSAGDDAKDEFRVDPLDENSNAGKRKEGKEQKSTNSTNDQVQEGSMDELPHGGLGGMPNNAANSKGLKVDRKDAQSNVVDETLNQRAVEVIERVRAKLRGTDFQESSGQSNTETLDVPEQVKRLINQATSHENLCQCYLGWSPFW